METTMFHVMPLQQRYIYDFSLFLFIIFFFTGAAFTRFQTMRFRRVFPRILADSLISYGSCQFPTLGFVVERYKQINDFISEMFWKLRGDYCERISRVSSMNDLKLH